MRGEYEITSVILSTSLGSPPLARGILPCFLDRSRFAGITPACAGNTQSRAHQKRYQRDHPRLRGEYSTKFSKMDLISGSPPLARGIPLHPSRQPVPHRITPACAGNTRKLRCRSWQMRDPPRLRGEYRLQIDPVDRILGSPPLARGIPCCPFTISDARGITPACAGNTYLYISDENISGDHPRLRGEYAILWHNGLYSSGSPPLARGILVVVSAVDGLIGITPACAGNTPVCL